jgi:hypothetical protein
MGNAANNPNLQYNKDVGRILKDNLTPDQQKTMANLENEKVREGKSKSGKVDDKIDEAKKQSKSLIGKSTVSRVLDKIGNDTGEIIGIPKDNDKKSK